MVAQGHSPRASNTWRWRKCPDCGAVERASDFLPLQPYRGWGTGTVDRECPNCGHIAETSDFRIVREYHPAASR
jgi:predicted RNA-binding Zn-ribbon protein involved in translation (DUF1610 family)